MAKQLREVSSKIEKAPEKSFQELDQSLANFDLRNDSAHALTLLPRKLREKHFSLIDRWLACLVAACPEPVEKLSC